VARAWWFGLAPLLATLATLRWLVPPRSEVGPGLWGRFADAAARFPLVVAVALLLLFAGLARAWRDRLPLGRLLASVGGEVRAARTLPQRVTSVALVALVIMSALVLRSRLVMFCEVVGTSMLPTLLPEDTLIVNRRSGHAPRRGDLIAFRVGDAQRATAAGAEPETADRLVKRVIGLPGDHIEMKSGVPIINGWQVPFCDAGTYVRHSSTGSIAGRLVVEFLEDRTYLTLQLGGTTSFADYEVPPGEVFVLGDDRPNSEDSRSWRDGQGAGVPVKAIEGRAWRVIGADSNGQVDLRRFLEKPGLNPVLSGMDASGLRNGIERCLKARPARTWPPPPGPPGAVPLR
jgi:signal peptidase I